MTNLGGSIGLSMICSLVEPRGRTEGQSESQIYDSTPAHLLGSMAAPRLSQTMIPGEQSREVVGCRGQSGG